MTKPNDHIRYTNPDGESSYDGLSPDSPMPTVARAVKSLPVVGSGFNERYAGTVFCSPGVFLETETIPVAESLHVYGSGTQGLEVGTTIRREHDGHLMAPPPTFTDFGHHVILENLRLDGNKANFPAQADLLQIQSGGFNTALTNVFFHDSSRHGLFIKDNAVNVYLFNCTAAQCYSVVDGEAVGSALKYETASGANNAMLKVYGMQIDDCGKYPIQVIGHNHGGLNVVAFDAMEFEVGTTGPNQDLLHDACFLLHRIEGANSPHVDITGVSATRSGGPDGTAVIYDPNTNGRTLATMRQVHGENYGAAYRREGTPPVVNPTLPPYLTNPTHIFAEYNAAY